MWVLIQQRLGLLWWDHITSKVGRTRLSCRRTPCHVKATPGTAAPEAGWAGATTKSLCKIWCKESNSSGRSPWQIARAEQKTAQVCLSSLLWATEHRLTLPKFTVGVEKNPLASNVCDKLGTFWHPSSHTRPLCSSAPFFLDHECHGSQKFVCRFTVALPPLSPSQFTRLSAFSRFPELLYSKPDNGMLVP